MKRTLILFAAAASLAVPAMAQTVTRDDLRENNKEVKKAERKLDSAEKYGSDREVARRAANLEDAKAIQANDRARFHAERYVRPTGWVERSWVVGDRLPETYSVETYWVEPVQYKLAPPADGERWVRVDNDVVRIGSDGTVREIRKGWFYQ